MFPHTKYSMDRKIGFIFVALIAAILFYISIGYPGWGCGEEILSSVCTKFDVYRITGALILTAALLVTIAAIFLIIELSLGLKWANIIAIVLTALSAILAIAGVFYYLDSVNRWSPFLAAMAMSFTIALVVILLMDIFSNE